MQTLNLNTHRYKRTMDEAFGPYHRSSQCIIVPMRDPEPRIARSAKNFWLTCKRFVCTVAANTTGANNE